jgi:hypothetical protein
VLLLPYSTINDYHKEQPYRIVPAVQIGLSMLKSPVSREEKLKDTLIRCRILPQLDAGSAY